MLYTQVLVLTGQFEAAIEFLSRMEHLRHHAVHMALVLYESNLLFLPSSCQAPLRKYQACMSGGLERWSIPMRVKCDCNVVMCLQFSDYMHF